MAEIFDHHNRWGQVWNAGDFLNADGTKCILTRRKPPTASVLRGFDPSLEGALPLQERDSRNIGWNT
jgi:hypothetical protein